MRYPDTLEDTVSFDMLVQVGIFVETAIFADNVIIPYLLTFHPWHWYRILDSTQGKTRANDYVRISCDSYGDTASGVERNLNGAASIRELALMEQANVSNSGAAGRMLCRHVPEYRVAKGQVRYCTISPVITVKDPNSRRQNSWRGRDRRLYCGIIWHVNRRFVWVFSNQRIDERN